MFWLGKACGRTRQSEQEVGLPSLQPGTTARLMGKRFCVSRSAGGGGEGGSGGGGGLGIFIVSLAARGTRLSVLLLQKPIFATKRGAHWEVGEVAPGEVAPLFCTKGR